MVVSVFFFLPIVNRASMNMAEQISVEQDVKSFWPMPSNRTAGPYNRF